MIPHAILHDMRLAGRAPGSRQGYRLYRTNGNVSLNWTLNHIKNDALEQGGIDVLHIYCHGYVGGADDTVRQMSVSFGGLGLELGRESLTFETTSKMRILKNTVSKIVVHACAAADSSGAHLDLFADGRRLMGEIALHSGAYVTAADQIQWYTHSRSSRIDFGDWEGNVLMLSPDTGLPVLVGS
ncbi:hypothetical protein [Spirosoma arcticum]